MDQPQGGMQEFQASRIHNLALIPRPKPRGKYATVRIKPYIQGSADTDSQQGSKNTRARLDSGADFSGILEGQVDNLKMWNHVQDRIKHPRMNHWWILFLHKIRSSSRRVRHSDTDDERASNKAEWNNRSRWRFVHESVAWTFSFAEDIDHDTVLGNDTNGNLFRTGTLPLWFQVRDPVDPTNAWRRIDLAVLRGNRSLDCDWILGNDSELLNEPWLMCPRQGTLATELTTV